jgi:hypothetical protein
MTRAPSRMFRSSGYVAGCAVAALLAGTPSSVAVPSTAAPARLDPPGTAPSSIAVRGVEHADADAYKVLESISADAPDDVWAVGIAYDGDTAAPFTMHWNGARWSVVPSNPGGLVWPVLVDVVAISPDDVWAVGNKYTNNSTQNLIMHWDGTSWSVVTSPQPPGQYLHLTSVGAMSSKQVYASGIVCQNGEGDCAREVLRWNGREWSLVTHPPASQLDVVSASAPDHGFGVGSFGARALSARWDGSRWSQQQVPSAPYGDRLFDVSDGGRGAVWAVGTQFDIGGHQAGGYLLHWSGGRWKVVDAADDSAPAFVGVSADAADNAWVIGGTDTERWDGSTFESVANPLQAKQGAALLSVQTLSSNDAWMLGSYAGPDGDVFALMHFDGTHWKIVHKIGTTTTSSTSGVSALSRTDAWSVGGKQTSFYTGRSVISHWDGASWKAVGHPTPGVLYDSLYAVDARTASDVWAVGVSSDAKYSYDTLIEHWDGSSWTKVPSPNHATDQNYLRAVSADAPADAWAVGGSQTSYGDEPEGLAEHWDGASWTLVDLPEGVYDVRDVAATSPSNAWAVGYQRPTPDTHAAVVMHWDGVHWLIVESQPDTSEHRFRYQSVVASTANDVWVLGSESSFHHSGGKPEATLALHWDGTAWAAVPTPKRPFPASYFTAASTDAAGGLWAVGYEFDHYVDQGSALIEHWDGSRWMAASLQPQRAGAQPLGVSAGGPSDAWAVGVDTNRSLLLHWNGKIWRR